MSPRLPVPSNSRVDDWLVGKRSDVEVGFDVVGRGGGGGGDGGD